jgi:hypothetical protein
VQHPRQRTPEPTSVPAIRNASATFPKTRQTPVFDSYPGYKIPTIYLNSIVVEIFAIVRRKIAARSTGRILFCEDSREQQTGQRGYIRILYTKREVREAKRGRTGGAELHHITSHPGYASGILRTSPNLLNAAIYILSFSPHEIQHH